MPPVWVNAFSTTLAAAAAAGDPTLTVATGAGALLPVLAAGDLLALTLESGTGAGATREIVSLAGPRTGTEDVIGGGTAARGTLVRGAESTTALAWASGVTVEARATAGQLGSYVASTVQTLTSARQTQVRTNIGLGGAAVLNVGTGTGTVAAGDDSRFPVVPTKRAITRLSGSANATGGQGGITDVCNRFIVALAAPTTRWRLRVRNGSPSALSAVGVYLGTPAVSNGAYQPTYASAPTQAIPAFTTPADGSDYTTAWVTSPALQFGPTSLMLSWGFTCASGTTLMKGANPCQCWYGTGASASAGGAGAPTGAAIVDTGFADVRLEYEALTVLPRVLVVGDSTAAGQISGASTSVFGPNALWHGAAGLRERFLPMNAALGGATYGSFTSSGALVYTTLALGVDVTPDVAILACGLNDTNGATALATFQSNVLATVATVRALGAARVLIATVPPQGRVAAGLVTAGAAAGATTLQTSLAFTSGQVVDLAYGTSAYEQRTTSGASTGTGPYTTTLTAATTQAHAVGDTAAVVSESRRMDYHQWMRSGVPGVDGVLEFGDAIAMVSDLGRIDAARFASTGYDGVHFGVAAHGMLASRVRVGTP